MKKYSLLSLAVLSLSLLGSTPRLVLAEDLYSGIALINVAQAVESDAGTASINYTVPETVPAIAQPKPNACWATSATMMVSWHDRASYSIEQVMDKAGEYYSRIFEEDTGLFQFDQKQLFSALNMIAEAPQSYTVEGLLSLLKNYGPLWVTTDVGSKSSPALHDRIVIGMTGDGTLDGTDLEIIDPAYGNRYNESFRNFMRKFEQVASGDIQRGEGVRIQVVHF
ncbi:papain-like cysteine protease family protein [uncultured Nostoc sp.]|uniref:papain-like cysteine protease family protein n=1 Tax=uncultured Nostoc sp. TaxID=340711 RepID=UPI0035C9E63E